ncbi:hypothetical protein PIB30_050215 [Stylosanthes scabra]|uniref:Uncharacterized protein n=1 Tax=Stylosanthes scabra TaxID=79078 RepID=A0ABU6WH64_9FABA|nr:hypothetical protein [Stylosanthes scabra]
MWRHRETSVVPIEHTIDVRLSERYLQWYFQWASLALLGVDDQLDDAPERMPGGLHDVVPDAPELYKPEALILGLSFVLGEEGVAGKGACSWQEGTSRSETGAGGVPHVQLFFGMYDTPPRSSSQGFVGPKISMGVDAEVDVLHPVALVDVSSLLYLGVDDDIDVMFLVVG